MVHFLNITFFDYIVFSNLQLFPKKNAMLQNCAVSSLNPYIPSAEQPWNAQRIAHLYRRTGAGASYADMQNALALSPSQLVDQLIDEALALAPPTPPFWANYTAADYDGDFELMEVHRQEVRHRWITDMATEGLRSKMAFFWHNHFVTELQVYGCNNYLWTYYTLLHNFALGNFRTFVEEVGKTPAMLVYLNGNENIADEPNENYARELMELFTMGEGNGYTQDDIVEVARALTGWACNMYQCLPVYFDNNRYDNGSKTIFGQTGNWNYDDVHELIFTLRQDQVAQYICEKIYRHFVSQDVDQAVVSELAETFKSNNWELAPVLRQLFKSEHFFDSNTIATTIKSPVEMFLTLMKPIGLEYPADFDEETTNYLTYVCMELGQLILDPVDVAGWPGHRTWLNENTLAFRWGFSGLLLFEYFNDTGRDKLLSLAINLTDTSNDPGVIVDAISQHFLGKPLSPEHREVAILSFKGDIPENYFEDGSWNLYWDEAPFQLLNLVYYLSRLPEFQLM